MEKFITLLKCAWKGLRVLASVVSKHEEDLVFATETVSDFVMTKAEEVKAAAEKGEETKATKSVKAGAEKVVNFTASARSFAKSTISSLVAFDKLTSDLMERFA